MSDDKDNLNKAELEEVARIYPRIDTDLIKMMFANWNPFPDKAYCEKVGWHVNADGTVDTPGLGRVPTRDLCEVKELEQSFEVAELKALYERT